MVKNKTDTKVSEEEKKLDKKAEEKIKAAKKKVEKEIKDTEEIFEKVSNLSSEGESTEVGRVIFMCPKCGKGKIKRSFHERQIATKYICDKCGFEGPN